jgi:Polyketide cyclase / dehydrase and lipid transport
MARLAGEIIIELPAGVVFDFVADERNEPRYNPKMRRAEQISDGPIGVGTRFRAETVSMGRAVVMVIEFTGFERPRRIEETVHMSSMDLQGGITFDPVPEGTRMRWSWHVEPRGMLKVMCPLVARMGRRQEQKIWGGLKHLLEGQG